MAPFFFKSQSQPSAASASGQPSSSAGKKAKPAKSGSSNGQLAPAPAKSFFSLSNSSRQKLAALDPLSPSLPSTPTLQQQQQQSSPTSPASGAGSDVYPYPHSFLDERDLYPSPAELTRSTSAEAPPSRLNPARLLRRKASFKKKAAAEREREREREREPRGSYDAYRDEEQLAPEGTVWHRRNGSNGSLIHSSSVGSLRRAASPIDMQYRPQASFHSRRPSGSGSALGAAGLVTETLSSPVMMHHFGSAASLALGYTGSIRSMRSDDSKRLPIPFIHDGDMVVSEVIEHPFLNAGASSSPSTSVQPGPASVRAPSPAGEHPDPSPRRTRGGNPPPPLRPAPNISFSSYPSRRGAASPLSSDSEAADVRVTAEWLARKPSTRRRVQPSFTSLARDERPPAAPAPPVPDELRVERLPERRGSGGLAREERTSADGRRGSDARRGSDGRRGSDSRRGSARDERRGSDGRDRARGSGGSGVSAPSSEDADLMTPVLSPRLSGLPARAPTFPPPAGSPGHAAPGYPGGLGGGLGSGLAAGFYAQKAGSTSSLKLPVEKHPRACSPAERPRTPAAPPLPSPPQEAGAYEVSVVCVPGSDEVRWEIVMRKARPGTRSPATGQVLLGRTETVSAAPTLASSVNLSLALDMDAPGGRMVFISRPEAAGAGAGAGVRQRTRSSTSPRGSKLDVPPPPLPKEREREAPLPPLPSPALQSPLPPLPQHGHGHKHSLSLSQAAPSQPQPYYAHPAHPAGARPLPVPGRERSQLPYAQPYSPQSPQFFPGSHAGGGGGGGPPAVLEPAEPAPPPPPQPRQRPRPLGGRDREKYEGLWHEYRF